MIGSLLMASSCETSPAPEAITYSHPPPGEIKIDTLQAWVSPDSASWYAVLHFEHREAAFESFLVRVDARTVSATYFDSPIPPPPLTTFWNLKGTEPVAGILSIGDTSVVEFQVKGRFYDPSTSPYSLSTPFDHRVTLSVRVDTLRERFTDTGNTATSIKNR